MLDQTKIQEEEEQQLKQFLGLWPSTADQNPMKVISNQSFGGCSSKCGHD